MKLFKAGLLLGVGLLVIGLSSLTVDASYQCLELNGSGYASIADGSQAGLDMGLSDFMVEALVKTNPTGVLATIATKNVWGGDWKGWMFAMASDGTLYGEIDSGEVIALVNTSATIHDGRCHYVVFVVDRSSSTGLKLYIEGSEGSYDAQDDPSAVLSIDNAEDFIIGEYEWYGYIDEVRVWNFGVDGLPTDYATYIAWRALRQNAFSATSEYNSDSWSSYVTNNLSAYYKFSGNYTDETSNNNDLTAGGSGNTFPTYTLKRQRIISPASVN